jgi:membrane protease YdiL (CAAX protease family)
MQPKQSFMSRLTQLESPVSWSLLLALFFVLAYAILWIAGQIVVTTLSGGNEVPTPESLGLGALLGSLVIIIGTFQWARQRSNGNWISWLSLHQPKSPAVFVVVLTGLGAAWTIDLVGVLLKLKTDQIVPPVLNVLRQPIGLTWVLVAIFAIIIQPVAEGLVFGGVLFPALARDLHNNIFASLLTALIYALVNAAVLTGSIADPWYGLLQPFLMLLVVALVRANTQSTQSAIVTRALFGVFFVLAAVISARF